MLKTSVPVGILCLLKLTMGKTCRVGEVKDAGCFQSRLDVSLDICERSRMSVR